MSREDTSPTLHEVLQRALEGRLAETHTSMPGRVEAFDPTDQTVDVQPLLKRTIIQPGGSKVTTSRPLIQSVPVVFPRGGGWRITWPLAVGDLVLLVFAERALDRWLAGDGAEAESGSSRKHDLTDAIAIAGLSPFSAAIPGIGTTDMVIGREDGSVEIRLTPTGAVIEGASVQLGAAATEAVLLGDTFADLFASHVHPSAMGPTGAPALGAVPIGPAQIAAAKSAKVRVG